MPVSLQLSTFSRCSQQSEYEHLVYHCPLLLIPDRGGHSSFGPSNRCAFIAATQCKISKRTDLPTEKSQLPWVTVPARYHLLRKVLSRCQITPKVLKMAKKEASSRCSTCENWMWDRVEVGMNDYPFIKHLKGRIQITDSGGWDYSSVEQHLVCPPPWLSFLAKWKIPL